MALFFYAQKNKENYRSVVGCGELHYVTQEIMIFLRNWKKPGEGLAGHHGMPENILWEQQKRLSIFKGQK